MRSSYNNSDVTILLKDVTGMLNPLDVASRERRIQSGVHYSEMLPVEYKPSRAYLSLFHQALAEHGQLTASAVKTIGEKIWRQKAGAPVLVSLARAGTPVGILIKRYLEKKYNKPVPHYTISIIRGKGIDHNAVNYILSREKSEDVQFVDGWIGKGAIIQELRREVHKFPGLSGELAVLSDPAKMTALYGTSEDFLIPNACLNATVSGLFSRTILNREIIGPEDFHGAVYFEELADGDLSNAYIDTIESYFDAAGFMPDDERAGVAENALSEAENIRRAFGVADINFVKPGIGETTRVLLRRLPWKILIKEGAPDKYVGHIKQLCKEKQVAWERYPLKNYRACGIIKNIAADA